MKDKIRVKNIVRIDRLKKLIDTQTREEIAAGIGCETSLVTKHYNEDRKVTIEQLMQYCKYFKVSADYLLNLSNAKTNDATVQAVCDYTGLSETIVETLHALKESSNNDEDPLLSELSATALQWTNRILETDEFSDMIENYDDYDRYKNEVTALLEFFRTNDAAGNPKEYSDKVEQIRDTSRFMQAAHYETMKSAESVFASFDDYAQIMNELKTQFSAWYADGFRKWEPPKMKTNKGKRCNDGNDN